MAFTSNKTLQAKTSASFRKVKTDMEAMKDSVQSWISFLHKNQEAMKEKIAELEAELKKAKAIQH